ncbi:hypothetical protein CEXT_313281 [Caerostris extrusa]|uniref:Uncharacterized protein n=1 Tax=Caerostris extrusa TaxID=172846 RepID=A0AAV4XND0_CAEEX|nr:hypothetical protein CEXT_313281 [Caerostris extrusa]
MSYHEKWKNDQQKWEPWYNRTVVKCPVTLYANIPNEYSFHRIKISKLFPPKLGKEYKVALYSSSESSSPAPPSPTGVINLDPLVLFRFRPPNILDEGRNIIQRITWVSFSCVYNCTD